LTARLTPKQREANRLLAGPARNIMLRGGSRSGKTFLLCRAIVQRAINAPASRHAIFRFRFNHAKTSIWADTLPKVLKLCFPTLRARFDKTDFYVELPNGSQIWIAGLDDSDRVEKILGAEYCVDPDAKILTSDLRWVAARDVQVGDELIGFPEDLEGHCTLQPSKVERADIIQAERYRITTDKGVTIVSAQHKMVCQYDDRRHRDARKFSWKMARDLEVGDLVRHACEPWEVTDSREDGWFAGMLDGEGWVTRQHVGVAQCRGPVLDALKCWLKRKGVDHHEYLYAPAKIGKKGQCIQLRAMGLWPSMRLLGIARPMRLQSRGVWEGRRAFTSGGFVARILKIEPLGMGPVVSLGTSTRTFIADGFLAHNCTLYFNESSQIPWGSIETAMSRLAQKCELAPEIAAATGRTHLALKAYFDCNPPSKLHWSYQLFRQKLKPGTKEPQPNPDDYVEMKINPDDNRENLPEEYFDVLDSMSAAKRLRFKDGEWASEVNGALWSLEDRRSHDDRVLPGIDSLRLAEAPQLRRIVVAVDPSGTKGDGSGDDIGIVVAGLGMDGHGYVLEDATCQMGPEGWGRRTVERYGHWRADRVIGEANFGGDMVRFTVATADRSVPYKDVKASRGKAVRAEPISALYEQGKVHHVGTFPDLEDQMCNFTASGYVGEGSPDRADALVWALTELMLEGKASAFDAL
jgi:phage terminase large subunit-like protein